MLCKLKHNTKEIINTILNKWLHENEKLHKYSALKSYLTFCVPKYRLPHECILQQCSKSRSNLLYHSINTLFIHCLCYQCLNIFLLFSIRDWVIMKPRYWFLYETSSKMHYMYLDTCNWISVKTKLNVHFFASTSITDSVQISNWSRDKVFTETEAWPPYLQKTLLNNRHDMWRLW